MGGYASEASLLPLCGVTCCCNLRAAVAAAHDCCNAPDRRRCHRLRRHLLAGRDGPAQRLLPCDSSAARLHINCSTLLLPLCLQLAWSNTVCLSLLKTRSKWI